MTLSGNCTQAEVTMLDEFAIEESRKGRMDEKRETTDEEDNENDEDERGVSPKESPRGGLEGSNDSGSAPFSRRRSTKP